MSDSEEKVSVLRQNLEQNSSLRHQIKQNLNDLRNIKNKNQAELEGNVILKNTIETCNDDFITFAQHIYSCNQELHSDLNLHNNEVIKNEELLDGNSKIIEKKTNEYKTLDVELTKELELLDKNMLNQDLEYKATVEEINKIEAKIKKLEEERSQNKEFLTQEMEINEQDYTNLIENLKESTHSKENEISEFSKLLEEVDIFRENLQQKEEANILELECQIKDSEAAIKEGLSATSFLQMNIDEISKKIKNLEEEATDQEKECKINKKKLDDVKINLKMLEEDCTRNCVQSEHSILEKAEICKKQCTLQDEMKLDITAITSKIDHELKSIQKILDSLAKYKKDTNLNTQLMEVEGKKKKLKTAQQGLTIKNDKRIMELEIELKRDQEEIRNKEVIYKKLQDDTEKLISELNRCKNGNRLEIVRAKRQEHRREIGELDGKIKTTKREIAQTVRKKPKTPVDKIISVSPASTGPIKKKVTRSRHWDSDSSVEDVDRSVWLQLKKKRAAEQK